MIAFTENVPLYQLHELQHATLSPMRWLAGAAQMLHGNPFNPLSYTSYGRNVAAAAELLERITRRYAKPVFGIAETVVEGKTVVISEEVVETMPFCRLLHFKKKTDKAQPQLLIVAPMSGHHATLLRGTVEALLPYSDVFITDWLDARDVSVHEGDFDLHTYINYVMQFTRTLSKKGGVHLLAVCQPSVPVFAAAAIMNQKKDKAAPKSMTLIGGPIDTRKAPTKVNLYAKKHAIAWFEKHCITRVPYQYGGFMRRVYPGFLQLSSFITMNLEKHVDAHAKFFNHLVVGDGENAQTHKKFYDEYLSVSDITAEFYLQTLEVVFQKHLLPDGKLVHEGVKVDPGSITKTALLCLEGELDDISGLGQTKAAMDITTNLPANMKRYHMEPKVGHYGIFNGRKFRENVVPIISKFLKEHA
jgi:poly(3-hydroxybutyrate) depolymerase